MPQRGNSLKDTFVCVDTDATQTHNNIDPLQLSEVCNHLDPSVLAGYDLFVCSDRSCQHCLKTTKRQQVTTAETKALREAYRAKEIIGRRDY